VLDEIRSLARACYRDLNRRAFTVSVGARVMAAIKAEITQDERRLYTVDWPHLGESELRVDGFRIVERPEIHDNDLHFEVQP